MNARGPYDPATDGAQMQIGGRMSYGDYLNLDAILGARRPLTDARDEMPAL